MKIAIWGLGISGVSALKYLASKNEHTLFAVNAGDVATWPNKAQVLQYLPIDHCINEANCTEKFDQIIISPGVDKRRGKIKEYIDKGISVISDIELMYQDCHKPIVAITGTNGKTTTTTMMHKAFELAGKKVFCGGNIGTAACEYFQAEYDLVVLELSSFQLESLDKFKADVAIILNITPSHMERYDHFDEYKNAKLNITDNQTEKDLFIASKEFQIGRAKFVPLSKIKDYDFSHTVLIGEHQKENLFCVEKALEFMGVVNFREIVQKLLNEFSGVKYRLQFVADLNGVRFINDAKSTNIDATFSAIKTLASDELVLILGGQLRSQDVSFVDQLKDYSLAKVYVFGEARTLLQKRLKDHFEVVSFETLKEVILDIKKNIHSGTVLLSPAFPSFDQYKSYTERGEEFNQLIIESVASSI